MRLKNFFWISSLACACAFSDPGVGCVNLSGSFLFQGLQPQAETINITQGDCSTVAFSQFSGNLGPFLTDGQRHCGLNGGYEATIDNNSLYIRAYTQGAYAPWWCKNMPEANYDNAYVFSLDGDGNVTESITNGPGNLSETSHTWTWFRQNF